MSLSKFLPCITLCTLLHATEDPMTQLSVGLATFNLNTTEIKSATIENGIIRVTDKRNFRTGPWLQAGSYFSEWPGKNINLGFFVGTEVSTDNKLFSSAGIGPSFRFKRGEGKLPINVGFGYHWSTVQVLGDGFTENQSAPQGAESIRYRTETTKGWVVSVSFGF